LRNAASNRCYVKIGFTPVCDAFVYHRKSPVLVPAS
jgi:predicted GNAT family acetyltransferase